MAGAPLNRTLDALTLFVESQERGARCGILLVNDDEKSFRRGAGPSLPEVYHTALDGAPISPPYLGSCGEAADRSEAILVPDISAETRYSEEWRSLMSSCGIAPVRSTPVIGSEGRVLWSLAIYYDRPRDPNPDDPQLTGPVTHLASIAIERANSERALQASEEQLRLAIEAADIGLWDVDPINGKLFWPAHVRPCLAFRRMKLSPWPISTPGFTPRIASG